MKYITPLILLLASCQAAPHVDFMYGSRNFNDSSEWEQTDDQNGLVGVQVDFAGKNGFGIEVGATYSEDAAHDDTYVNRDVDDVMTGVRELYVGIRKNWMATEKLQVSLSGGMSTFRVKTAVDLSYAGTPVDISTDYSPYAQIGSRFFLTNSLTAGIMYRHHFLEEEANIFVTNPDLDGGMTLITIGWAF